MQAVFALMRKDLLLFLQDKRALFLTLVMPIALAAFFGSLTGGAGTKEATKIELGLVVEDTHAITVKIVAGLKAESTLNVKELDLAKAQELVRKGKLAVAIQIPVGFGSTSGAALFGGGAKAELPIFYDPSQTSTLAMVKGMLTQQVMQSVSSEMFSGKTGSELIEKDLQYLQSAPAKDAQSQELLAFLTSLKRYQDHTAQASSADGKQNQAGTLATPFVSKEQALTAKSSLETQYNGYSHSFAGMIVQFMLFMAIDVGIGVLFVRKLGIWNRILVAPVSLNTLLGARALSCALISFALICVIFALAMLLFQVRILGSWIGFFGIALSFSLMTASFGLLIAAFGKTPEAARGIAVFVTLVMVMLGGAWMPSFLFPAWLQQITVFIPTRWAVDGFDAMTWRGLGFDAALPAIAALCVFSLLFFSLAQWRFKKQQA